MYKLFADNVICSFFNNLSEVAIAIHEAYLLFNLQKKK